jgi:hypothetical protein
LYDPLGVPRLPEPSRSEDTLALVAREVSLLLAHRYRLLVVMETLMVATL